VTGSTRGYDPASGQTSHFLAKSQPGWILGVC
jgi:hypothetical protein